MTLKQYIFEKSGVNCIEIPLVTPDAIIIDFAQENTTLIDLIKISEAFQTKNIGIYAYEQLYSSPTFSLNIYNYTLPPGITLD